MAKYLILKKRRDFLKAARDVTMVASNVVVQAALCFDDKKTETARVGYTATKKLGKAYYRNLTKRRLRAVVREIEESYLLKNVDYVLVGRKNSAVCPYKKLKDDVTWALHKTNDIFAKRQAENEKDSDSLS